VLPVIDALLQAGVAMGLARIAGTAFSDWGPSFQTVMMAIIMINMLLGPPLFRTALIQVSTQTVFRTDNKVASCTLTSRQGIVQQCSVGVSGRCCHLLKVNPPIVRAVWLLALPCRLVRLVHTPCHWVSSHSSSTGTAQQVWLT
jgi:hypothetical protein